MLKNKSTKKKVNKELLRRPDIYVAALSNKEELTQARTATTGEKFNTLDERIDCEVDRLNKKIDVTMLQQEDKESHTIENTVDGMTTDMVIRGKTLQNLASNTPAKNAGNVQIEKLLKSEMFKVGTTYTISIPNRNNKPIIIVVKTKDGVTKNINLRGSENTFTVESEYPVVYRLTLHNTNGWDVNNDLVNADKAIVVEGNNVVLNSFFEGIKSFGEQEDKISILSNGKNIFTGFDMQKFTNSNSQTKINSPHSITVGGQQATFYELQLPAKKDFILSFKHKGSYQLIRWYNTEGAMKGSDIGNKVKINTEDGYVKLGFFVGSPYASSESTYYDIQIEEGTNSTYFEPYKEDKKDILLSELGFDEGLRGLNDIVYDELNSIKNVVVKRVDKYIVTGNENFITDIRGDYMYCYFILEGSKPSSGLEAICNQFKYIDGLWNKDNPSVQGQEGFDLSGSNSLSFQLSINKLETHNTEGVKKYFKSLYDGGNPVEVYYWLAEPIETPLDESIALKVFNEKTYVEFQNSISGTSIFKAPVNAAATIARLNRENRALEEENKTLRQDFESTTLVLTDSDLELVKQNVDIDFRLMEVEFALDIPQAILSSNIKFKNKKGEVKSMARTPYEMMKIVILSGDYDREDYIHKVGKYYERGRMTKEEHDELMSLMTADEVISK